MALTLLIFRTIRKQVIHSTLRMVITYTFYNNRWNGKVSVILTVARVAGDL